MGRLVAMSFVFITLVVLAAGASAQSTNVVITRAEAQGTHPFVAWSLAPGWCSNVVAVAKSPATGSDGSFFSENLIDGGILDDNQTSWLSSSPSVDKPGTYYVRVQAFACDLSAGPDWSATATIVKAVPPPPAPPPTPTVNLAIKAEGYNGYDTTGVVTRMKVGKRYWITLTVLPPRPQALLTALTSGGTKLCVAKKGGKFCGAMVFSLPYDNIIARIVPSMVVAGRVTVFAEFNGERLTSKRYRVVR